MWQGLIYGPDGIDPDIAYNLIKFYGRLGIRVRFSVVLEDADLLIMTRADNAAIDLSAYNYRLIHVYDYLGREYDRFIKGVDWEKTYIFTTSEKRRERIIRELNFSESRIYTMLLPVEVSIWTQVSEQINRARKVLVCYLCNCKHNQFHPNLFYAHENKNRKKVRESHLQTNIRFDSSIHSQEIYLRP